MSENIHHLSGNLLVGSSHFYVDTTNNRVGITTADPQAGLHVNSNAYVDTDFRVGSGIEMNVTSGRITAGSFEGDGSLLENVPGDSGSWVKGSSSNVHLATLTDKVGIGTVSPATYLHLSAKNSDPGATEGDNVGSHNLVEYLRFTSTSDSGDINSISAGFKLGEGDTSSSPVGRLDICANSYADGDNSYGSTPDVTVATFLGSGNVGIGTSTFVDSRAQLHIPSYGSSGTNAGIAFQARTVTGNSRNWRIATDDMADWGSLQFSVSDNNSSAPSSGSQAVMTMLRNRNVGIGTVTPETALHVNGSLTVGDRGGLANYSDAQVILGGTHNQGYNQGNLIKLLITGGNNDGSSPKYIQCEDENGYDQFIVKGATSDGGGDALLYIKGEVKMQSAGDRYSWIPGNDGWLRLQGAASGQGNKYGSYTSVAVGNFWSAGSTRFSSDDRVKHFEEEIPNALELIQQLKPYKYKKTTKIYDEDYTGDIGEDWEWEIGLIAQDVEKIPYLEHVVSKPEDSPGDTYGLNYTEFIGVCIQGIKDLSKELNNLKEHTHPDLEERVANHTHPLEPHTHPLEPHTHPLEEHTHPLEPHTHPLEPHTHPLEPHTHPLEEHTHPEIAIEKAKTHELQQRLTLIEHSHAALVARLEALENI